MCFILWLSWAALWWCLVLSLCRRSSVLRKTRRSRDKAKEHQCLCWIWMQALNMDRLCSLWICKVEVIYHSLQLYLYTLKIITYMIALEPQKKKNIVITTATTSQLSLRRVNNELLYIVCFFINLILNQPAKCSRETLIYFIIFIDYAIIRCSYYC